jgi:hypothetical protein
MLEMTLTISFAGIPLVDLSVSWTRDAMLYENMTEPFGDTMEREIRQGFLDND